MYDENDRSAIRAIQLALPDHLKNSQVASAAGIARDDWGFNRKFKLYEDEVGGWKCARRRQRHATRKNTS
jgi:hypothetical protein